MSDAYCKEHYISYCPELSKTCPYCRIKELEARLDNPVLLSDWQKMEKRIKELEARLDAVQKDFAGCMRTAAEDIEDWGAYASPYFQEKHGLSTDVQRYRNKADELQAALEASDEND